MKYTVFAAATFILLLTGCSRDYTPPQGASGEEIFASACLECHEALEGKESVYYELASDKRNVDYIANRISSGSLMMPKFPNISGTSLTLVSQYALEHSVVK